MTLLFAFLLLVVNIALVYVFKSEQKFWFVSIPLWLIMLTTFIRWRLQHDQYIKHLEAIYWQSAGSKGYGDYDKMNNLEKAREKGQITNMTFIDLCGLQTLLTFGCQLTGKKATGRKVYKWTFIVFSVILVLYMFLRLMMGVVPSGGIIT